MLRKKAKRLFHELPFYNASIEKTRMKRVKNIDLLHELIKKLKAFKRYERSYKVEIIASKARLAQLEARKSSIKDFFKDLKYEINKREMKGLNIK